MSSSIAPMLRVTPSLIFCHGVNVISVQAKAAFKDFVHVSDDAAVADALSDRDCAPPAEALGLKWERIWSKKQLTGTEISNDALASGLEEKTEFSRKEWEEFGVSNLTHQSYIKAGDKYFKPAPKMNLDSDTPIAAVFYEHVERIVYSHTQASKMLVLDDDCELFAALINKPVPAFDGSPQSTDITVRDIAGSKFSMEEQGNQQGDEAMKQDQWSLLTFSFNLNPALRDQLASEISALYSDSTDHMIRGNQDAIQLVQKKKNLEMPQTEELLEALNSLHTKS